MVGLHWFEFVPVIFFLALGIVPWIIGFTWVRQDADRHGQPGTLWAVLTLPLGWLAILVYLVVRATTAPRMS
ncbi:MAG: hypothetical protein ABI068_13870 [Ktedonobacterales bacterium]